MSVQKYTRLITKPYFSLFYLILVFEFYALVQQTSSPAQVILFTGSFFLITLVSSFWSLWFFVAIIPLLNGLFLLKGWGDVTLAFTGIFLAWLPKKLFKENKSFSLSQTTFFADLLALVIMLNMFLVVARTTDGIIPSSPWLDWFVFFPLASQKDPLWQINAALILLKGIVFLRMIEMEICDLHKRVLFSKIFFVQIIFILCFSIFQLGDFIIHSEQKYFGVSLPFNDVHSYGSYVVFLFVVFTYYFFQRLNYGLGKAGSEKASRKEEDSTGNDVPHLIAQLIRLSSTRSMYGVLAVLLFILCILSFSRMSWVVMGLLLFLLVTVMFRSKKVILSLGGFIVLVFFIGTLAAPYLLESDNLALKRAGAFFTLKQFGREKSQQIRYEIWDRSFAIVKEFPLTGIGIGNFYRNQKHYRNEAMGKWDWENAHNYYLQLMTELGIPGLFLLLLLIYSLFTTSRLSQAGDKNYATEGFDVRSYKFGLAAYLMTLFTGHALLLLNQQFLFWSIVALISAEKAKRCSREERVFSGRGFERITGLFFLALFMLGFCVNIYKGEPWTIPSEYGFYSQEDWNGKTMRWMAKKASYYLPAGTEKLKLNVVAQPFNSQSPEGLNLRVKINNTILGDVRFVDGGSKKLRYDLRQFNFDDIKIDLEVDKIFCPREIGLNNDPRKLGVAIGVNP